MLDKLSIKYPQPLRLHPLSHKETFNLMSKWGSNRITHAKFTPNEDSQRFSIELNCKTIVLSGSYTEARDTLTLLIDHCGIYPPRILTGHNGFVPRGDEDIWTALSAYSEVMNEILEPEHHDKAIPGLTAGCQACYTYIEVTHQTKETTSKVLEAFRNMRIARGRKPIDEISLDTKHRSKVQTVDYTGATLSVICYDKPAHLREHTKKLVPADTDVIRIETKLEKGKIVEAFDQGKGNHVYELGDRVQTFSLQDVYAASRGILEKCRGVFNDLRPQSKLCKHSQAILDTIISSPGHHPIGNAVSAYFESTPRGKETIRKVRDRVEDYIASTSGVSFRKTFPPSMPTPVSIQPYKCKPFVKENEVGRRVVISYDPRIAKAYSKTTFLNINKTPIHTRPPINLSQPAKAK